MEKMVNPTFLETKTSPLNHPTFLGFLGVEFPGCRNSWPANQKETQNLKQHFAPRKINGWNLQITHLERKMIFQTSMRTCSMWIFRGVGKKGAKFFSLRASFCSTGLGNLVLEDLMKEVRYLHWGCIFKVTYQSCWRKITHLLLMAWNPAAVDRYLSQYF